MKIWPNALLLCGVGLLGLTSIPKVSADSPAKPKRVLLISVDGMHAVDLTNYVSQNPGSTFAQLSRRGVTYPYASTTKPSDSFPGLVAQVTGGTPYSAGIYYDVSYNRTLLPPPGTGDNTPGTAVAYAENLDKNLKLINGGGDSSVGSIDPAQLPRDPVTLKPIYPHDYLPVNTIFEVVKVHGGHTAWSDKHPAYDIVNGPSGHGVDDLYTPEINSFVAIVKGRLVDASNPGNPAGLILDDATNRLYTTEAYDNIKVQAIVHEIDGYDHTGKNRVGVPEIFGMNFQSVSVGQKLTQEPAQQKGADTDPFIGLPGGYTNPDGSPTAVYATPGPLLDHALDFVDAELGTMVSELTRQGLMSSTTIIISAKHGQSPIDKGLLTNENPPGGTNPATNPAIKDPATQLVDGQGNSLVAKNGDGQGEIQDDVALIWLTDQRLTGAAVNILNTPTNRAADGIQTILSGPAITRLYGDPTTHPKVPDIVVISKPGVIYTGSKKKVAEHGGFSHDDTNVLLLVANPGNATAATNNAAVLTTQIAPTILHLLGIDTGSPANSSLQAVKIENTPVLPGLGL